MARGSTVDVWDEVWAEYDSRQAARAPARPLPAARPAATRRRAGRAMALLATAGLGLLTATAYAAMPVLAAREISQALAANDPGAMQDRVDWAALHQALSAELAGTIRALPPGRTAGLGSGGAAYLESMAQDVSGRLATAAGLAAMVRNRLGLAEGAAPLPRLRALGLTSAEAVLAPPGMAGGGVSLMLRLRDPLRWRWQVVAVGLGEGQGSAAE
jgi:hypothetical protein